MTGADHQPDAELVARATAGDGAALDALLRRHHPRLRALCLRLTGNPTDADDACQEALVAVARGLARFDGRSTFSTWAYRVATNACLDELRRRRRRPLPGLEAIGGAHDGDAGAAGGLVAGGAVAGGPAAGRSVAGRSVAGAAGGDPGPDVVDRLDVEAALATLAPEFRAAVVLRDLCQLSYAEIADVLGVPPGTVRSRIARGRAALLPLLSGNPEPAPGRPRP
ncbi:MAG: RNA polymerase sigma factor [Acidimicrobiales bacterium]